MAKLTAREEIAELSEYVSDFGDNIRAFLRLESESGVLFLGAMTAAMRVLLALLACAWCASSAVAESALESRIRHRLETAFLADGLEVMDERIHAREVLRRVYPARVYQPLWVTEDGLPPRGEKLAEWLKDGPRTHGLRPSDYHLQVVEELEDPTRLGALVDMELALSDAFLMLATHFLAGRLNPQTLDSEWHANRRHRDLAPVLEEAATLEEPGSALEALLPDAEGYRALVDRLATLRRERARGGWPLIASGAPLRRGDLGERVAQLAARLESSGDLDGPGTGVYTDAVTAAVTAFQARHGLSPDGVVGRMTLAALNVPVQQRIDQVIVNLERWRWLPESLGARYVLVNIAGFDLAVVEAGQPTLTMRVVVGRPYRRTPVFSGTISYLVLNPSWEVPSSIAVQDKLPLIKADPSYLGKQGYSLLQGWGADERVIDPRDGGLGHRDGAQFSLSVAPGARSIERARSSEVHVPERVFSVSARFARPRALCRGDTILQLGLHQTGEAT